MMLRYPFSVRMIWLSVSFIHIIPELPAILFISCEVKDFQPRMTVERGVLSSILTTIWTWLGMMHQAWSRYRNLLKWNKEFFTISEIRGWRRMQLPYPASRKFSTFSDSKYCCFFLSSTDKARFLAICSNCFLSSMISRNVLAGSASANRKQMWYTTAIDSQCGKNSP